MARRRPRNGSQAAPGGNSGGGHGVIEGAIGSARGARGVRMGEHVVERNRAAMAIAPDAGEIESQMARRRARHGQRAGACRAIAARHRRDRRLDELRFRGDRHAADHCAGIEIDQRRAGGDDVAD